MQEDVDLDRGGRERTRPGTRSGGWDRREKAADPHRRMLPGPPRWLGAGLGFLARVVLIAWASFAIYYSNLPWPGLRLALAVAFAGFAAWVFWLSRRRRMRVALAVLFLGVVAWWIAIPPSHDRPGGRKSR